MKSILPLGLLLVAVLGALGRISPVAAAPAVVHATVGLAPLPVQDVALEDLAARLSAGPSEVEPGYSTLDGLLCRALAAAEARRGRVRAFQVGETVKGAPIWGFVVRGHAAPLRARMLVFANMHAMEWVGAEVVLAFLEEVTAFPPDGVEMVLIPVLNVDGRRRVEADLAAGRVRWRRGNAHGVDLNRDFAVNHEATSAWRFLFPGFHQSSPAPLSQPESRAIDALLQKGPFDLAVSLHAFGGFVYAPWSGRWERPPDWERLAELGRRMVAGQGAHAYRFLQLSRWGFFFRAQGSEIDHIYGTYGTPAYLVELTRSGIRPFRSETWTHPFRRYNPAPPDRHVKMGVDLLRAGAWALAWESGRLPPPVEVR